ncbi:MAG: hypothetical protein ACK5O9_01240 [Holosporales bacterium]|jgi:hypothetical protein
MATLSVDNFSVKRLFSAYATFLKSTVRTSENSAYAVAKNPHRRKIEVKSRFSVDAKILALMDWLKSAIFRPK